ncbi:hypothetical protein AOLI_G00231900 [Acnodon oligacanthus]
MWIINPSGPEQEDQLSRGRGLCSEAPFRPPTGASQSSPQPLHVLAVTQLLLHLYEVVSPLTDFIQVCRETSEGEKATRLVGDEVLRTPAVDHSFHTVPGRVKLREPCLHLVVSFCFRQDAVRLSLGR